MSDSSSSSSTSAEDVEDLGGQIASRRDPFVSDKAFVGASLFYSVVP